MQAFSLANLFKSRDRRREREEAYLAKSTDLADLERRQREILRGQYPGW